MCIAQLPISRNGNSPRSTATKIQAGTYTALWASANSTRHDYPRQRCLCYHLQRVRVRAAHGCGSNICHPRHSGTRVLRLFKGLLSSKAVNCLIRRMGTLEVLVRKTEGRD